ncbi:hypothetical protein GCM10008171_29120 [Methylopila jiangsuensis]|uniref:Uncharacterized protein n=1 Tax=Methylopila jiangsuensis TaxID=586230 RepID=A0A9W6JK38_9HYPH|nr:hypothetical protein [Methylopila jiangsuensis]MDR6284955.1 hypothetical protein [Methylopila jiangsuensis]GLK77658.1 hypothetical protein GCM10008171_29120 [Methylopila jiangsuensis]
MRNYDDLVRQAREQGHFKADQSKIPLTTAILGKLIVAAWAAENGRSDLPRRERVMAALLDRANDAPAEVRQVMHVDRRLTGPVIAEYSEYLASAQIDGLIKRYNPDYVRVAVEIDRATGADLLNDYRDRPAVVEWVKSVTRKLLEPRSARFVSEQHVRAST